MTIRTQSFTALLLAFFMLAATGCDSSSDPAPTTGTISGSISLPAGAGGDIVNTRVQLFETLDEFTSNSPTFTTTTNANGEFTFNNINPDSYFVSAWKDNNNSGDIDGGDFFGVIGTNQIEGFVPSRQQVVAGENTGFSFTILILPPGFGVSVTGTYSGTTSDNEAMSLTLTQNGTAITGTGSIIGPGGAYQVNIGSVTGTFNAPNLNLSLTSSQLLSAITLQGTVSSDGSTINATLNGGATGQGDFYTGDTATLNLQ